MFRPVISLVLHNQKTNEIHMLILRLAFLSIFFFNNSNWKPEDKPLFVSPVKIPLALSANFGELRIDHFHSGVDIKTQGVTGKEVVAAADGYIYRISISPNGFGKALYIRHPSGYSTVYGHLERFTPEIDEFVERSQYEKKSFTVNLYPAKDKFAFRQGDLIAYSGNTGGSSGPHLHYEIRKTETEEPVNPLLYDMDVTDNIRPVIERLVIYPAGNNTLINGRNSVLKMKVSGEGGKYFISADNEIRISGPAGFGIKSFDQLNDNHNKCAAYTIELKVDSITRFRYAMDKFSFSETRYVNSHIDYEAYMKENTYYERAFVLQGDHLSAYQNVINKGIFNFIDSGNHSLEIILEDAHRNRSSLSFRVKSDRPSIPSGRKIREGAIPMVYNRPNRFRAENITLTIPSGALYDTLFFVYKKEAGTPLMYSDVHYVHNKFTPVHKAYTLSIKPFNVPAGKKSKMLIVQMGNDFSKSSIGGSWTEDFITANAQSFGMFYVGIDTVAPGIYPNGLTSGSDLTGKRELRIRILDDLSGIKSYEPLIDGKWALFEYDQKNNVLVYRFDPERITKGTKHNLTLKISDNVDNTSNFNCDFTW